MAHYIILTVVLAALLQTTAKSQEADTDGANVLGHFVGSWQAEVTHKPSASSPDGAKGTDSEYTTWTLKDRFILGRQITQPDSVKSLWLATHDTESRSYRSWFFNSKGVLGGEWSGTWDESTKTLTSQATDTPKGWTSRGTNHFPDKKSVDVAFWMKNESGTLLFDWAATKTRQPDEAGEKTLAAWSKTEKPDEPLSPEMKVLERLNGKWNFAAVSKPAEWTPKEVRTTGTIARAWALNRSIVLENSNSSDGQEGMFLLTYDPKQEAYRSWWFSSEGHTGKSTGQWENVSETLAMRSDLGNGMILRSVIRFIDKDHHDARVVVKDGDGKRYFDMKWVVTRSKK